MCQRQASKTDLGSVGSVFCCVGGLCPDNLCEAWDADTKWLLNIEAILFINSRIPASSYSYLSIQVLGGGAGGGSEVILWMKDVKTGWTCRT